MIWDKYFYNTWSMANKYFFHINCRWSRWNWWKRWCWSKRWRRRTRWERCIWRCWLQRRKRSSRTARSKSKFENIYLHLCASELNKTEIMEKRLFILFYILKCTEKSLHKNEMKLVCYTSINANLLNQLNWWK